MNKNNAYTTLLVLLHATHFIILGVTIRNYVNQVGETRHLPFNPEFVNKIKIILENKYTDIQIKIQINLLF
jgi:hypothetical protein